MEIIPGISLEQYVSKSLEVISEKNTQIIIK